jgi:hypothetical protein
LLLIVLGFGCPSFAAAARKHRTTKIGASRSSKPKRSTTRKPLGPRGIDDARATQIQAALIKRGYLTGAPSGHWDAQSQAAMVKLQGDNGWQTKLVPDSRALIKLGLGPDNTPAPNPGSTSSAASTKTSASPQP